MRLKKVLLFAAGACLSLSALVFTISCSGDDGATGPAGPAKECTFSSRPTATGIDVYCGDEFVGSLQNGTPGVPGPGGGIENGCVLGTTPNANGSWPVYCDGEQVGNVGGAGGGATGGCSVTSPDPYNKYELLVTCSSLIVSTCNGIVFDKLDASFTNVATAQICTNGSPRTNVSSAGDSDTALYNTGSATAGQARDVNGKLRLASGFKCTDDATSPNTAIFNPNKYSCQTIGGLKTPVELCGATNYIDGTSFCQVQKDGTTKKVQDLCGTTPKSQFTWQQFCGQKIATLTSTKDSVLTYCGYTESGVGIEYQPRLTGPNASVPSNFTGTSKSYTATGFFCQNDNVVGRCFDPSAVADTATTNKPVFYIEGKEFCRTSTTASTTNKVEVAPLCFNNSVPPVSLGGYDGVVYFCNQTAGSIARMCSGVPYVEATHFCYSGDNATIAPKCKNFANEYNPSSAFCAYDYTGEEKPVPLCGTEKSKYNLGSWNWQYCNKIGQLGCGINQIPENLFSLTTPITTPSNVTPTALSTDESVVCRCSSTYPNTFGGACINGSTSGSWASTNPGNKFRVGSTDEYRCFAGQVAKIEYTDPSDKYKPVASCTACVGSAPDNVTRSCVAKIEECLGGSGTGAGTTTECTLTTECAANQVHTSANLDTCVGIGTGSGQCAATNVLPLGTTDGRAYCGAALNP